MPDYIHMMDAARRAVAEACRICRVVQSRMDEVRAIVKDDKSPVTVADFAVQAVVAHRLRERLPAAQTHLVAEESSAFLRDPAHAAHLDAALAAARETWPEAQADALLEAIDSGAGEPPRNPLAGFWTLDPIDGTKGFLRGQQYCVCLAYIENARPVLGLLGCPNLPRDFSAPVDVPDPHGCLYLAELGDGVYEVPADDPFAAPVHIRRPEHDPAEPVTVATSVDEAHFDSSNTRRILQSLGRYDEPLRLDSQCKYALVARGQADAYLRLPRNRARAEYIWDHAPGALIAHEAGCAVSDMLGEQLDFGRGRTLTANMGIVCAPPALHGRLLGAIRERPPT